MVPGRDYVEIAPNLSNLEAEIVRLHSQPEAADALARSARAYAARAIAPPAVDCYLLAFLLASARLYAAWQRPCAGVPPADYECVEAVARDGKKVPSCRFVGDGEATREAAAARGANATAVGGPQQRGASRAATGSTAARRALRRVELFVVRLDSRRRGIRGTLR